ncbi:hypothetical protein Taro_008689 [Colocasia esculenta]|uniref:Uncharacterized protein n=1 Tax=Colocasia esculenta TaxID=4460 RepID=A0A843U2K1_COLES|nr:hypothetical protein [Colocasia esculenta]
MPTIKSYPKPIQNPKSHQQITMIGDIKFIFQGHQATHIQIQSQIHS